MPQPLQPSHSDFEYGDKMGLSAFEPQLIQDLVQDPAQSQLLQWEGFLSAIIWQKVIKFALPWAHTNLVLGGTETSGVR